MDYGLTVGSSRNLNLNILFYFIIHITICVNILLKWTGRERLEKKVAE